MLVRLFFPIFFLSFFLFSCAVPNRRIAGQQNFKKDRISKEATKKLQYYFSADQTLVLKRIHFSGRYLEKGVIYNEVSDSTFYVANNTSGVLEYVLRDSIGDDIFYIGLQEGFRPIPFAAKNQNKEFRVYVEGEIQISPGKWRPAVFLRDENGQLKEVWVVDSLDKNNRLVYEAIYKKKTTSIQASGKKVDYTQ